MARMLLAAVRMLLATVSVFFACFVLVSFADGLPLPSAVFAMAACWIAFLLLISEGLPARSIALRCMPSAYLLVVAANIVGGVSTAPQMCVDLGLSVVLLAVVEGLCGFDREWES